MAEAERYIAQRRGVAAFNAATILSGGFSQFSPALTAAFVRNGHSAKRSDADGIAGDARSFKRGDHTAIFAWIGRTDGSML